MDPYLKKERDELERALKASHERIFELERKVSYLEKECNVLRARIGELLHQNSKLFHQCFSVGDDE